MAVPILAPIARALAPIANGRVSSLAIFGQ